VNVMSITKRIEPLRGTALLPQRAPSERATHTSPEHQCPSHRAESIHAASAGNAVSGTPSLYSRIIAHMRTRGAVEQLLVSRRLPEGFPPNAMLPDYQGYSIVALPNLIERSLGLERETTALTEAIAVPSHDRVILLVLDGLGYRKTCSLFDSYPDLALQQLARRGSFVPLTSVFPSTTVTALTTCSTGLSPQEHGMIGYRLYLRETGSITNMIRLSLLGNGKGDSALDAGLELTALLDAPTIYERLRERGVVSHALLPRQISRSGLSKLLYRGCTHLHSTVSLGDMFATTRQIFDRATVKTFVTLYWPSLDAVAHARGPNTDAFLAEALAIDATIGRELVGRTDDVLLILCSDHGFVPMSPTDYLRLSDLDRLDRSALLPPVGEPRASYLFLTRAAREASRTDRPTVLANGLVCLEANAALELGLLGTGDIHPEVRHRLGDLVLVSTGSAGIYHPYPDAHRLRGMHGGLTEDEMLVPLIISPL
jgi:hypothetical protein